MSGPNCEAAKIYIYTYRTHLRIDRGLYLIYDFSSVGISLIFGGFPLMLCGLYMREVNFRERFILKCVRYALQFFFGVGIDYKWGYRSFEKFF